MVPTEKVYNCVGPQVQFGSFVLQMRDIKLQKPMLLYLCLPLVGLDLCLPWDKIFGK